MQTIISPDPSIFPSLPTEKATRTYKKVVTMGGVPVEFVWNFTLEAQAGFPQSILYNEKIKRFTQEYISGATVKMVEAGDGQEIAISERLIEQIALIMTMDKSNNKTEEGHPIPRYSFDQWAVLSERVTDVFAQVFSFAIELSDKAMGVTRDENGNPVDPELDADESLLGNAFAAGVESSCVLPLPCIVSIPT